LTAAPVEKKPKAKKADESKDQSVSNVMEEEKED
jgi:hypothetical protein